MIPQIKKSKYSTAKKMMTSSGQLFYGVGEVFSIIHVTAEEGSDSGASMSASLSASNSASGPSASKSASAPSISASRSMSPSRSVSNSPPSTSLSASPSASLSGASESASLSLSASPPSTSPSASPSASVSPSASPSASISPSASPSASISPSASVSPSASASVSVSAGDTTPPTPNPETWLEEPVSGLVQMVHMEATVGSDPSTPISYYFDCQSEGGHDSGWQTGNTYTDTGLADDTEYTYRVQMKDNLGNTGGWSSSVAARTFSN